MDISRYLNVYFSIIIWGAAFIIMKSRRIVQLLPVALLSGAILLATEVFFETIGAHKFDNPLLPILNIPLFHIIWGAGSGIIFIHFMQKRLLKKFYVILIFDISAALFGYISLILNNHSHYYGYTMVHSLVGGFAVLTLLAWLSEELFGDRIFSKTYQ